MTGLSRFAWRSLRARPLRTTLSVVGIALGVAVLFAALATDAGIEAGVGRTVDDVMGRSDLRVGAFEEQGLSAASLQAIRSTSGVALAAPVLEQRTYLQRDPLSTPDSTAEAYAAPVTVVGIDPTIDGSTGGIHQLLLASGRGLSPGSSSAALVPASLAQDLGLGVGDTLTLLGTNGPVAYRITGLLSGEGPDPTVGGRSVVVPLAGSSALFGARGASWVDIELADGGTPEAVSVALDQSLTFEPYVLSDRADLAASLRGSTVGFQALTALIAAVTLFGGAFLIFNTLSMTLSERVREIGLLRAAGTTRGQVHRLVLVQALILAIVGSLLGLVLGFGLSILIARTVGSLGDQGVPIDGPAVPPLGVVLAAVVGIIVTLAAALEPAIQAGRVSPIEALRPAYASRRSMVSQLRWLVAVVVTVGVAGLALWPIALGPFGRQRSGWRWPRAAVLRLRRAPRGHPPDAAHPWSARAPGQPALHDLPACRGAPLARLTGPGSEADGADRRRADDRAGDDRGPRRPGRQRPRRDSGLADRRDPGGPRRDLDSSDRRQRRRGPAAGRRPRRRPGQPDRPVRGGLSRGAPGRGGGRRS